MELNQVLPFWVREDLIIMEIKGYSIHLWTLELGSHHQMQFSFKPGHIFFTESKFFLFSFSNRLSALLILNDLLLLQIKEKTS